MATDEHQMVTAQEVSDRLKYLEGFRAQVTNDNDRRVIDAQCETLRWVLDGVDQRPSV